MRKVLPAESLSVSGHAGRNFVYPVDPRRPLLEGLPGDTIILPRFYRPFAYYSTTAMVVSIISTVFVTYFFMWGPFHAENSDYERIQCFLMESPSDTGVGSFTTILVPEPPGVSLSVAEAVASESILVLYPASGEMESTELYESLTNTWLSGGGQPVEIDCVYKVLTNSSVALRLEEENTPRAGMWVVTFLPPYLLHAALVLVLVWFHYVEVCDAADFRPCKKSTISLCRFAMAKFVMDSKGRPELDLPLEKLSAFLSPDHVEFLEYISDVGFRYRTGFLWDSWFFVLSGVFVPGFFMGNIWLNTHAMTISVMLDLATTVSDINTAFLNSKIPVQLLLVCPKLHGGSLPSEQFSTHKQLLHTSSLLCDPTNLRVEFVKPNGSGLVRVEFLEAISKEKALKELKLENIKESSRIRKQKPALAALDVLQEKQKKQYERKRLITQAMKESKNPALKLVVHSPLVRPPSYSNIRATLEKQHTPKDAEEFFSLLTKIGKEKGLQRRGSGESGVGASCSFSDLRKEARKERQRSNSRTPTLNPSTSTVDLVREAMETARKNREDSKRRGSLAPSPSSLSLSFRNTRSHSHSTSHFAATAVRTAQNEQGGHGLEGSDKLRVRRRRRSSTFSMLKQSSLSRTQSPSLVSTASPRTLSGKASHIRTLGSPHRVVTRRRRMGSTAVTRRGSALGPSASKVIFSLESGSVSNSENSDNSQSGSDIGEEADFITFSLAGAPKDSALTTALPTDQIDPSSIGVPFSRSGGFLLGASPSSRFSSAALLQLQSLPPPPSKVSAPDHYESDPSHVYEEYYEYYEYDD